MITTFEINIFFLFSRSWTTAAWCFPWISSHITKIRYTAMIDTCKITLYQLQKSPPTIQKMHSFLLQGWENLRKIQPKLQLNTVMTHTDNS